MCKQLNEFQIFPIPHLHHNRITTKFTNYYVHLIIDIAIFLPKYFINWKQLDTRRNSGNISMNCYFLLRFEVVYVLDY